MRITPLDIRKQEFRKVMRGLDPEEVYAFLATVADEYELVLNDNKALKERLLELDDKVQEYRNMEQTLRNTLITAERVNVEAKENARREADLIIKEAEIEAEKSIRNIKNEARKLRNNIQELKRQKESYISRLKMIAESHIKFIENMEKDFESEEKTLSFLSEGIDDEKTTAAKVRDKSRGASPSGEAGGTAGEVAGATGEVAGTAKDESPEVAPSHETKEPRREAKGQSILDKVPDLNEILDKMTQGQKETLRPTESGTPSPRATPGSGVGEAAPAKSGAPSGGEKRVDAKVSSPEPAKTTPPKEGESGGAEAAEEEWSLERLKRDILSGDSQGNEKNR